MKYTQSLFWLLVLVSTVAAQKNTIPVSELQQKVEIITDTWGVAHIYASTEHDLFFAQGYQAAKDRLYQFEIFRRKATGTMAALLGKRELKRDIGARLFKYRGNLEEEFAHYHPHGKAIILAFVAGVNAYIKQVKDGTMPMPQELQWLGITPGYWKPEDVISRHNGWLTNVQDELQTALLIKKIGIEKLRLISNFQPGSPALKLDAAVDADRLNDDVLGLYNAFRAPLVFKPEDLVMHPTSPELGDREALTQLSEPAPLYQQAEGSNNWAISAKKSASGFPLLANDPHRSIAVPSLRYIVDLHGPGWNVAGGGEPILPGVSIGHNEYGAWGLTIFETDAEDLYVYQLNPEHPLQYLYKGKWKQFSSITETIPVKNEAAEKVTLYYSVHGPVTYIDSLHHLAYAVKCGWLEKGGAPYLASLRMDQATNVEAFRRACSYSHIPAENMVWADKKGHILWQAVGIAPIRNRHSGMVPVPGNGKFEWAGYLPVLKRPHALDPKEGFIATANENNIPPGYPYRNAIGYTWSDAFRHTRIALVLGSKQKISMADMKALQTDYYSVPASVLIPLLNDIHSTDADFLAGRSMLTHWDLLLKPTSIAATVYSEWEHCLNKEMIQFFLSENELHEPLEFNTEKMIALLSNHSIATSKQDTLDSRRRDLILEQSLIKAFQQLKQKLGNDTGNWQYGQLKGKHVLIAHPFTPLVNDSVGALLNAGPLPRGGDENSVNSTGSLPNQTTGASFRILMDCSNWDLTEAINTPGQSGDFRSPHYKDLFKKWAADNYFPLYFSRKKVITAMESKYELVPLKNK